MNFQNHKRFVSLIQVVSHCFKHQLPRFSKKNNSMFTFPAPQKKRELQPFITIFFKKISATTVVFCGAPSPSVAAGASGPNELPEPKVMAADLGPERSFHGRPEMEMGNQNVK